MLTKQQYTRLTIVLAIPLLGLGAWLFENELVAPAHHIIECQELESHISCINISATKNKASERLYSNGAVRLSHALLVGGFNHQIITLGHSQLTFVDGEWVTTPPTDGGVKKSLTLPPQSIIGRPFSSCEILPHSDNNKKWYHSCIGGNLTPGSFYFTEDHINQKFQEAKNLIETKNAKNETWKISIFFLTLLTPLISYFLLSLAMVLLIKICRYVIYGRNVAD